MPVRMSCPSIPEKPRALPLISINAPGGAATVSLVFGLTVGLVLDPLAREGEGERELTSAADADVTGGCVGAVVREVVRAGGGAGALDFWPLFCLRGISRPLGFCAYTVTKAGAGAMVGVSAVTERAMIRATITLVALSFPLFSITIFT